MVDRDGHFHRSALLNTILLKFARIENRPTTGKLRISDCLVIGHRRPARLGFNGNPVAVGVSRDEVCDEDITIAVDESHLRSDIRISAPLEPIERCRLPDCAVRNPQGRCKVL